MHGRNEFSKRTKSLPRVEIVRVGDVSTSTEAEQCLVFYFNFSEIKREAPRPGFINVEDLVAHYEQEPAKKKDIRDARKWIAENFHGDEGDSLRALRLRRGLSQNDLAAKLRTTQSHIARIEGGQNVEVETLTRIAQALGVDPLIAFKAYLKQYLKT